MFKKKKRAREGGLGCSAGRGGGFKGLTDEAGVGGREELVGQMSWREWGSGEERTPRCERTHTCNIGQIYSALLREPTSAGFFSPSTFFLNELKEKGKKINCVHGYIRVPPFKNDIYIHDKKRFEILDDGEVYKLVFFRGYVPIGISSVSPHIYYIRTNNGREIPPDI